MNIDVRKQIAQILIEWRVMVRAVVTDVPRPKSKFPLLTIRGGICINILDNIEFLLDIEDDDFTMFKAFDMELEEMFRESGLDESYPFNSGVRSYNMERNTSSIHKNVARMEWVDKTIAKYG